jgi:5-methylcytosine-specific restriction endonuclease McrA
MKKKQAIRKAFRDVCLERDGYKCKTCGLKPVFDEELEVHHITDRNELAEDYKYVKENGISVCNPCHQKAEQFHISGGKKWVAGYHPDQLYALIGSRWNLAMLEQVK